MSIELFIKQLAAKGIYLSCEGDRLLCKAEDKALTPEIAQSIKDRKEEIIACFKKAPQKSNVISPRVPGETIPLSYAQQRLWFIHQFDDGSAQYNMPGAFTLKGNLDLTALKYAIYTIISRHEVLRTRFVEINGEVCQVITDNFELPLNEVDLSQSSRQEQEHEIKRLAKESARKIFDLTADILICFQLIRLSEKEHVLQFNMHHIASDGWSAAIFIKEFSKLYVAHVEGKENPLPVFKLQYADFALWQRKQEETLLKEQLHFWKEYLDGIPQVHSLPMDKTRPLDQTFIGGRYQHVIGKAQAAAINIFCRQKNVTLFMFMQTAFSILLSRYSNASDIVIGTPVAGRNHKDIEGLIGSFVNSLVLRTDLSGAPSFEALLTQNKQVILNAYAHQDLPFEMLVEELNPARSLSYSPLFQIMLSLQNYERSTFEIPGLSIEFMSEEHESVKFDLELNISEKEEELLLIWNYNIDLFYSSTVQRMAESFIMLLNSAISNPMQLVDELPILSLVEKQLLLKEFNPAPTVYAHDKTIQQVFEEQVQFYPDRLAVVYGDEELTYGQLNEQANKLAHYLRHKGVKPEDLVGIYLDRSVSMVVAVLGILKAGGAYVPIDPSYPAGRRSHMISNSGLALLVTQKALGHEIENEQVELIVLDNEVIKGFPVTNPVPVNSSQDLAYVIYTSGSTGKPKGMAIEHRSVINVSYAWVLQYGLNTFEVNLLQLASISFDVFTGDLCRSLLVGGKMVICPAKTLLEVDRLLDLMQEQAITIFEATPGHMLPFFDYVIENKLDLGVLKIVILGSDTLDYTSYQKLLAHFGGRIRILNSYGTTETTIDSCYYEEVYPQALSHKVTPIGRPLNNTRLYILDTKNQLVPIGVEGELCIGGDGVGRGYLGEPALNRDRFIEDPFSKNGRIYKTGDVCRWLPDGIMQFGGRKDEQIKIRGFRIEPGEVESQLQKLSGVEESVVMARNDGQGRKILVAFLVTKGDKPEDSELKKQLAQFLPDYMIPHVFAALEKLPLTPNGKIDKKALERYELTFSLANDYVAPRNETERRLATIFESVLNVKQVGINDNFFDLGGDSILSIQIVSRARNAKMSFRVKDIFEHQTVAQLATVVKVLAQQTMAEQGFVMGEIDLNPIQTWFFNERFKVLGHWNQAVLLNCSKSISVAIIQQVFQAIVNKHDALRLRYTPDGEQIKQFYTAPDELVYVDIADHSSVASGTALSSAIETTCAATQASLSLSKGPVFKAVCILTPETDEYNRLFVAIHHLVVDGVSWRIILDDLQKGISALQNGQQVQLGQKSSSFSSYVTALKEYANGPVTESELGYWQQVMSLPVAPIPVDRQAENLELHTRFCTATLSAAQTSVLLKEVNAAYNTKINDLLLCGLAMALHDWTQNKVFRIILEGHGREDINEQIDLTQTIGWFTTMFPVVLQVEKRAHIASLIKTIKEALHTIPNGGIGYGALRYLHEDKAVRESLNAPDSGVITFNYLGQFDNVLSQSGLFRKATENAGPAHAPENHRTDLLTVNASVTDNQLVISIGYSDEMYLESTISALASYFTNALGEIIGHCQLKESKGYTPSDFPLIKLTQAEIDNTIANESNVHVLESVYPLTPVQEGMLFHSLYDEGGSAYVEQLHCEFNVPVNIQAFKDTWSSIVQSHSILRSSFVYEGLSRPAQRTYSSIDPSIEILDYSHLSTEKSREDFEELCISERGKGFDFGTPPLFRIKLVKMAANHFGLIWTDHHILMDGWSMPPLLKEFFEKYEAACNGKIPELISDDFEEYISYLNKLNHEQTRAFWTTYLKGIETSTPLPFNKRSDKNNGQHDQTFRLEEIVLPKSLSGQIEQFVKKHKITQSILLQGCWALLLSHYSREKDVLFGVTVSGRPADLPGVEQKVGSFINTIPVRANVGSHNLTPVQWLQELQAEQVVLREHQYNALTDIHNWSDVPNAESLFSSIVVFSNYPINEMLKEEKEKLKVNNIQVIGKNNYPLTVVASSSDQFRVKFIYNEALYSSLEIEQLSIHLRSALQSMTAEIQIPVNHLEICSEEEKKQIYAWQGEKDDTNRLLPLHLYIEQQVERTPDNAAISLNEKTLSYADLNVKANRLASYLLEQEIGPDDRVVLYMERSFELMVCLLGIMKSGAAYIPIDPHQKGERLSYMLSDADPALVIVQPHLVADLSLSSIDIMTLGEEVTEVDWLEEYDSSNPEGDDIQSALSDTAYIIYTSGSTGQPKGVEISRASLMDYCAYALKNYYASQLHGSLVATSHAFDLTIPCLYVPLLTGHTVNLIEWGQELNALAELLCNESCDNYLMRLTPMHVEGILSLISPDLVLRQAHVFVIGGEQLFTSLADVLQNKFPEATIYNHYGPTETVVGCCIYNYTANGVGKVFNNNTIPIGRPMANTSLFILNEQLGLNPVGIAGELYIGGPCVGKGYLKQPQLTAQKFITNPFISNKNDRLYKTGDLARWLPDGNIEFVGRMDEQIKIRGYRIEPGEVQSKLADIDGVADAVVLAKPDDNGRYELAAFVVLNQQGIDAKQIRSLLGKKLPEYMIPASVFILQELPLTPNKKIDRRALLNMDLAKLASTDFIEPRTPVEKALASIFIKVLKLQKVGIHDNFFELGGHSLLATQLISAIRYELKVELAFKAVFENPTLAGIARLLSTAKEAWVLPEVQPLGDRMEMPLSYAQRRLWIIDQLEEGSIHYNMPGGFRLEGDLNIMAFKKAIEMLIDRHEILRTRFVQINEEVVQVVRQEYALPLDTADLSGLSEEAQNSEVKRMAKADALQPFDLGNGVLIRFKLLVLSSEQHVVLFNMHHIVSDGWSRNLMIREFSTLYHSFCAGDVSPLPALGIQYGDYASWQRGWLKGEVLDQHLAYWKNQLDSLPAVHSLPLDKKRPAKQSFDAGTHSIVLDKHITAQIKEHCQVADVTLFIFLQTAFATLLGRYSNETDIVMGTPVAGRNHKTIEDLIGLFVNTVVIRSSLEGNPSFEQLLQKNKRIVLDAFTYQHLPYEMLVEELKPDRNLSYNPICQVKFVLQNYERDVIELPAIKLIPLRSEVEKIHFDLDLTVVQHQDELHLHWSYKTELFECATIERMASCYTHLISEVLVVPAQQILNINLIDSTDTELMSIWQGNMEERGRAKCIHEYFEEQADKTPLHTAVKYKHFELSYEALNSKANALANLLAEQGIGAGDLVGIYLERSPGLMVSLLGVMKSGAAYVPLDPAQSGDRLRHMISDANISLVLIQQSLVQSLALADLDILVMDDSVMEEDWLKEYEGESPANSSLNDTAYVIYTSGSTGMPKGVEITHSGLIDYCAFALHNYYAPSLDGSQVATSHAFDLTLPALFVPLLNGTTVNLLLWKDELQALTDLFGNESCGNYLLRLTPMHVQALLDLTPDNSPLLQAHVFVIGGAQFAIALAQQLMAKFPNATIYNHYGPTETVVGCSLFRITETYLKNAADRIAVPIGQPMENTTFYVLNEVMMPTPPGVIGELYVGGPCVGKGYLHQPEMTSDKFIANPFGTEPSRLYRTGDRVRWLPDGNFEFVGRADEQVKIRGYRVEPGEVCHVLLKHEDIHEAVVLAVENNEGDGHDLIAYYVSRKQTIAHSALDAFMQARLPAYMVPLKYIHIEAMPLTRNGKTDKRQLLSIRGDGQKEETLYAAPRTTIEIQLSAIWSEVLTIKNISIHDNFFAIGGHSLKATQLVSRIRRQFGNAVTIRDVFERPTIGQFAALLADQATPVFSEIKAIPPQKQYPLTDAQRRLWIIDQIGEGSAHYNMQSAFHLHGVLDKIAFRKTIEAIIYRHEILRTHFIAEEGEPWQVVRDSFELPLQELDLSNLSAAEQLEAEKRLSKEEANYIFDLSKDLMIRFRLLLLENQECVIMFNMHHIASDGWSKSILTKEFLTLYQAFIKNEADPLPPLMIQYRDFACWQKSDEQREKYKEHLAYWTKQLEGIPQVHNLSRDKKRLDRQTFDAYTFRIMIGKEQAAAIKEQCRQMNVTLFMYLETIFGILLSTYSRENDIVIGTPAAGRDHKEIEGLIGFFINVLVLRIEVNYEQSFEQLLNQNKQTILDAFLHQHLPYETLVDILSPERNLSYNPLCQVKFALQNYEREEIVLPDVKLTALPKEADKIKFDLDLTASEINGEIQLTWSYKTELFEEATIQRMASSYSAMLDNILKDARQPLFRLTEISLPEKLLLQAWNGKVDTEGRAECIYHGIEQQAKRTPLKTAVRFKDQSLDFDTLNKKANRLANYLNAQGIGAGDFVGVYQERSLGLMVCLLGVMKSGAAYVPLDPKQKGERLEHMIAEAGVKLLLVQEKLSVHLTSVNVEILSINEDIIDEGWMQDYDQNDPANLSGADALNATAYCIFTSGSTGKPKGVEIPHSGLTDYCVYALKHYYEHHLAGSLVVATHAFDLSVPALYLPLLRGDCVTLLSWEDELHALALTLEDDLAPAYLLRLTPMHVQALLSLMPDNTTSFQRHVFVIGGAQLTYDLVLKLRKKFPNAQLSNHYGPTETVVGCCIYGVSENFRDVSPASGVMPIGQPMPNTTVYVLNPYMQLTPLGVTGELYIGGPCVGKGYVNQPELTKSKFIPDPFNPGSGQRLYRTGDLVRWLPSGNLEFIGRTDEQVKINGYRVELGEIMHCLAEHGQIAEVVVLALPIEGKEPELVAYIVAKNNEAIDPVTIRNFAAKKLPAYMIPSRFEILDHIPLNRGKVDARKLAEVRNTVEEDTSRQILPKTEKEELLFTIWNELLNKNGLSITDNFFLSGGDSIKAIQMTSKVSKSGLQLSVKDIFEAPILSDLALRLQPVKRIPDQGAVNGELPLTPIQLDFFAREQKDANHYNQAVLLNLPADVSPAIVSDMYQFLMQHHDALRIIFPQKGKKITQFNQPSTEAIKVSEFDLSNVMQEKASSALQKIMYKVQASINVHTGSLIRLAFIKLPHKNVLFIAIHHLIIDTISWRILQEDLETLYRQYREQVPFVLPLKTDSYRYWAEKLEDYAVNNKGLKKEKSYWKAIDQAHHQLIAPDLPDSSNLEKYSKSLSFSLSPEHTRQLLTLANEAYATEINDILLTALGSGLSQSFALKQVKIAFEGHGREEIIRDIDISRTVGWFTSIYPVLLDLGEDSIEKKIKLTRNMLRKVPDKGIGYLISKYLGRGKKPNMPVDAKPGICFNYLGQFSDGAGRDSAFTMAEEDVSGAVSLAAERKYELSISGRISEGSLTMSVNYSTKRFKAKTIKKLMDSFSHHLQRIIEHCVHIAGNKVGALPPVIPATQQNITSTLAVTLQAKGSGAPLFAVSGIGGDVSSFSHLVGAMQGQCPVYGLIPSGMLRAEDRIMDTIEEIATYYIGIMKSIQPTGPYQLLGYSFGASVIFEMARQLELMKDHVSFIAILDHAAPVYNKNREMLSESAQNWDAIQIVAQSFGVALAYKESEFLSFGQDRQMNEMQQLLSANGIEISHEQIRQRIRVRMRQASINYVAPAALTQTQVLVFKAERGSLSRTDPANLWGWEILSKLPPILYEVPGDHLSIINSKNVPQLTGLLKKHLTPMGEKAHADKQKIKEELEIN